MKVRFGFLSTVVLCFFCVSMVSAKILYVTKTGNDLNNDGSSWIASKITVQAAVDAAVSGDEVWVASGTYIQCINLKAGVELYGGFAGTETEKSHRDRVLNETILDGNKSGSVVYAPSDATLTTVIDGFTIRNGSNSGIRGGSPTISNNIISGNTSTYSYGGGICCGSPTILNNSINGNSALGVSGSPGYGGGIYCSGGTISNNNINSNRSCYGGGISGGSIITNNIISNNTASDSIGIAGRGGGICGGGIISYNIISGNNASGGSGGAYGGGIYNGGTISNNIISGNSAIGGSGGAYGGGISDGGTILNNTITGNVARGFMGNPFPGGGVSQGRTVVNNIIAFNSSGIYLGNYRNNCVYNPGGSNYGGGEAGMGDISADPLFIAEASASYHLSIGSPCIDAGDDSVIQADWTDKAGQSRKQGLHVDMGAYESVPDIEPPTITIINPTDQDDYSTAAQTIDLSGTSSDNAGITSVSWSSDRGENGTCSGTESWTASGIRLHLGVNVITLAATDAAGNAGNAILRVTYNPPSITATATTGGSVSPSGTVSVNYGTNQTFTITPDNGYVISDVEVDGVSLGAVSTYTFSNVSANHTIEATFSVLPIVVTIINPTDQPQYSSSDFVIDLSGTTSENAGVVSVNWTNDRGDSGTCTGTTSWSASSVCLKSGNNVITVTATGMSGNIATDTLTVTCTAPGKCIFVKKIGDDANDGTTWDLAKATVQAGINAAAAGDQLWVAAGTYIERLNIENEIDIYGGFPAEGGDWSSRNSSTNTTILDGNQAGSVVNFSSLAGASVLDGFTVQNGKAANGGGIYCINSSPIISHNKIISNTATTHGGGIYAYGGSLNISENVVVNNTSIWTAGIWIERGTAIISSNTISDNNSYGNSGGINGNGGGITATFSITTIENNAIERNVAGDRGGGIDIGLGGQSTISGNTIRNNKSGTGGGIWTDNGAGPLTVTITNNVIDSNTASATYGGGGIAAIGAVKVQIQNNQIINNKSATYGGGISSTYYAFTEYASTIITNNNIANNQVVNTTGSSTYGGGGVYVLGTATLSGNSIANNRAISSSTLPYGGGIYSSGNSIVTNNKIVGNSAFSLGGTGNGGGIAMSSGTTVANNNIVSNGAYTGGGIYCGSGSSKIFNNTIVSNTGSGIYGSATISNNLVAYNSSGITGGTLLYNNAFGNKKADYPPGKLGINGNISQDPLLADWKYGNYHVLPGSPCIDAGDDLSVIAGSVDVDSQARIIGGHIDIGADESNQEVWQQGPYCAIKVSTSGNDGNDGLTWSTSKRTVQAGIDASSILGGEVWVASGTYTEQVVLKPYAYLYGGFAGDEDTKEKRDWTTNISVIDGDLKSSALWAAFGGSTSCVDGFTITRGKGFQFITAPFGGGGIFSLFADLMIRNNAITSNTVNSGLGGGIRTFFADPTIVSNLIKNNSASSGAAIYVMTTPSFASNGARVLNNTIVNNTASGTGSVVSVLGNIGVFANNLVAFNSSGISVGATSILNNNSYGNTAYNYANTALFGTNGNISENPGLTADWHMGLGSPCFEAGDNRFVGSDWVDIDGQPRIMGVNVDIGADEFEPSGSVVPRPVFDIGNAVYNNPTNVVVSCSEPDAAIHYTTDGHIPTESDPIITSGASILIACNTILKAKAWKTGLIPSGVSTASYRFKVPPPTFEPDEGTYSSTQYVRISCITPDVTIHYTTTGIDPTESDPVIMSGSNVEVNRSLPLKAKAWKINWDTSDVKSADYLISGRSVIRVSPNGSDDNDGANWNSAKRTVQSAVDACVNGMEIWVSAGTYTQTITLKSGVALYGGFVGAETFRNERNWTVNQTIIDGNQGATVVNIPSGAPEFTRIDGCTVRNGSSYAISCSNSSPTISNNTIESNGVGVGGSNSSPIILNNTITGNSSYAIYCSTGSPAVSNNNISSNGKGIYCSNGSPTISNNTITNNRGSGIYCVLTSSTLSNNTIAGNTESSYGGGIHCINSSSSTAISNNIILGNAAKWGGGIACEDSTAPTISNNTIAGNTASDGGGIYCGASSPAVSNNIVAFNSSGAYRLSASGSPVLCNNDVYGNTSYNYSGLLAGAGDISLDPLFANLASGDYHLSTISPCIDAGNDSVVQDGWTDIDGLPRILGSHVDIGAYECPLPPSTITSSAGTGGSISPVGIMSVYNGTDKKFTITPDTGYVISDVKVDGASVGSVSAYTFTNVTANHTIETTFARISYTITASAGSGGSISPSGAVSVDYGTDMTFTIVPNPLYSVAKVFADGVDVGALSSYTFTGVTINHTISALFGISPVTRISDAKILSDNSTIALGGKVIIYASANFFYIEEDNRAMGIRVEKTAHGLSVGMRVDVVGVVKTGTNRERYILASSAVQTPAPNETATVAPLAMNNYALGGGDWKVAGTKGQRGITEAIGLNNVGSLVKTWGRFYLIDATTFEVDDGSGLFIRCTVPSGTFLNSTWQCISVTGISSIYKYNSVLYLPLVLVRDIEVRTPVETVSAPGTPVGNTSPTLNVIYAYTTIGSTCSQGHNVQYSFNWGDGSSSPWSDSTSASHSWTTTGPVNITVSARCKINQTAAATSAALAIGVISSAYTGEMIYIPAGEFPMGNNGSEPQSYFNELPQHSVYLSAYYIGKYEVTRGDYKKFMEAGGYDNPDYWSVEGWAWKITNNITSPRYWDAQQDWGTGTFTQTDNHPVVGVGNYEADAFCKWTGGRLPTEAEWEKAARWNGSYPLVYPWGNTWDAEKCNVLADHNSAGGGYQKRQTSPVGSYPTGASPYGCQDMAGNAWEWCSDWDTWPPPSGWNYYLETPDGGWINPQGPATGTDHIIRGGGWDGDSDWVRCARRNRFYPASWWNVGFRVVKSSS